MIVKLTIDTQVFIHYLEKDPRPADSPMAHLLALAQAVQVELAVTFHVHEDVYHGDWLALLLELETMGVPETPGVMVVGRGRVGIELVGDKRFVDFHPDAKCLAAQRGGKEGEPNDKDWHWLHAHYLMKRDHFLTWERAILRLAPELRNEFGVSVMSPKDYLARRSMRGSPAGL